MISIYWPRPVSEIIGTIAATLEKQKSVVVRDVKIDALRQAAHRAGYSGKWRLTQVGGGGIKVELR